MKLNELKEKVVPTKKILYKQLLKQGLTKEEKDLFKMLRLYDSQEVVKYIINIFWLELSNINDKLNDIQEIELNKLLGTVDNAKAMLKNKYGSSEQQNQIYSLVYNDLQMSIKSIMRLNKDYANKVVEIDNLNEFQVFLNRPSYYDSIKYSYLARRSLEGIISGMTLLYALTNFLKIDVRGGIGRDFSEFLTNYWFKEKRCEILGNHDHNSEFWHIIPYKAYEKISENSFDFSYNTDNEDIENINWDNIEF